MLTALLTSVVFAIQPAAPETPETPATPSPAEMVDAEHVMAMLRALPKHRAVSSNDDQDRLGLARTEGMIEGWLRAFGHHVQTQTVEWPRVSRDATGPYRGTNYWIDLKGWTVPGEVYIIGAHFDAVEDSPGTDDNGTGTVAALELARVLAGRRHERTIRIMFYTAEEVGLIGSRAYVNDIVVPAIEAGEETILGMVSLEMLGYFTDEPDSQQSPIPAVPGIYEPPTVGDFIAVVGIAPHRKFVDPFVRGLYRHGGDLKILDTAFLPFATRDLGRSDHAPFWAIQVPAVMLTDTANFRNPHYHTPTDTVLTIDAERFVKVIRAVAGSVHDLAGPIGD
ncbi:MAG: M20/M25/M40 family metallo-hydrolase [Planctomycetota bacterium]